MRLPNGYGSVFKLSGTRRNPWVARKTTGYNDKGQPVYRYVGYYTTRRDAMEALTASNADIYDYTNLTFEQVYEKWSVSAYEALSVSSVTCYKGAYKLCSELYNIPFSDIKLQHLQHVMDTSGKNAPTLHHVKNLFSKMWDFAVGHEMISPERKNIVSYVEIKAKNPNKLNRSPFTASEIAELWAKKDDSIASIILILIYTGVRIGELLSLKKSDVFIHDRYFKVTASKTKSGIREVPIADKIFPLFKKWYDKKSEFLISDDAGNAFQYTAVLSGLKNMLEKKHTPHDTRHTCISMLTEAGIDTRIIKQIVGHASNNVTESVYTHIDIKIKIDAINRI